MLKQSKGFETYFQLFYNLINMLKLIKNITDAIKTKYKG